MAELVYTDVNNGVDAAGFASSQSSYEAAYARDMFQTPGFGDTTDFDQIKEHHYVVHTSMNPTQVVPAGPDLAIWLEPHGRASLGGQPFDDGTPPGPPPEGERVDPASTPLR